MSPYNDHQEMIVWDGKLGADDLPDLFFFFFMLLFPRYLHPFFPKLARHVHLENYEKELLVFWTRRFAANIRYP